MEMRDRAPVMPAPISLDEDLAPEPQPTPEVAESPAVDAEPLVDPPIDQEISEDQVTRHVPTIVVETSSPSRVNVGRPVQVQLQVGNVGDVDADGVQLHVTMPEHADFAGSDPPPSTRTLSALRFDVGTLHQGSIRTVQLTLIPRTVGALQVASAVRLSAVSAATIRVCRPQLHIACETPEQARFGEVVTFRLVVRNTGDGLAENVTLAPQVIEPADAAKSRLKQVRVGSLEPGQERQVHYKVPAIGKGLLQLRFAVADSNGAQATAEGLLRVRRAVVEVANHGPRVSYLGRDAIYEVSVSNPGDSAAEDVHAVCNLPPGAHLIAVDRQVRYGDSENSIVWSVGSLEAGVTEVLRIKLRLASEGDNMLETVAKADGGLEAQATQRTHVISRPNLNISVTNNDGPMEINSETRFVISVENIGSRAAENVRIRAHLPPTLTPVEDPAYNIREQDLIFPPLTLAPDEKLTLQFRSVGRDAGDHLVRVTLDCESMSHTLSAEESTFFFDTRDAGRLSRAP
jgi:hypothetical protein